MHIPSRYCIHCWFFLPKILQLKMCSLRINYFHPSFLSPLFMVNVCALGKRSHLTWSSLFLSLSLLLCQPVKQDIFTHLEPSIKDAFFFFWSFAGKFHTVVNNWSAWQFQNSPGRSAMPSTTSLHFLAELDCCDLLAAGKRPDIHYDRGTRN